MALVGNLEEASHEGIRGWAFDPERPREAVVLDVVADGAVMARVVANTYREDLERAGIGDGRHSFELGPTAFKLPLQPCAVHVRDAAGADLPNSPARVETPFELNAPARQAIVALVDTPGSDEALRARATFLAIQANRLLDRLSRRQSSRDARLAARARKWRWRPEDGPEPPPLAPRALVIDSAAPGRGVAARPILSHMRALQRLGYEVVFAPADMREDDGQLAELGIALAAEPWTASVEELLRRQNGLFDVVYLRGLDAASHYLPLVRHAMPRARRIYAPGELPSLRLARQAKVEDRPELAAQANYARMLELTAVASSHCTVAHSGVEAASLRQALPRAAVEVLAWAIPSTPASAGFDQRQGLAFLGRPRHAADLDAAIWLLDEIMPLVWRTDPAIELTLSDIALPPALAAAADTRIHRHDDRSAALAQARLTVAPLAFGAGLAGQVAESLAAGVPCVCTPVAAEGFDLPDAYRTFVADAAPALADAILRLYADPAAFASCRTAGLAYAARALTEAAVDAGLRRAVGLPAL